MSIEATRMAEIVKSEIKQRTQGMNEQEMKIAVRSIPSSILWDELRNRFDHQNEMISSVRATLRVSVNE